jgi:hypothetical protein
MSRLMSVAHTTDAVRDRRKTVTRRLGWTFLKAGDRLTLCRKVQGRKPGEPLERLAEVEVVDVRREPLFAITDADVDREGVPADVFALDDHEATCSDCRRWGWVDWFCETFGVRANDDVTRIEWRYLS